MLNQDLIKQESNLTLVQKLKRLKNSPTLLLDTSGSMCFEIEPGVRRIDALRNIVKDLQAVNIYSFSSECQRITRDTIPDPSGSTYMSKAFRLLKENGVKNIILLTDGECDSYDAETALEQAKGLNIQIMYIGSGEAPEFLKKLAACSGSFCTIEDLKKPKELTEKLRLLISGPENENKGTIIL